MHYFKTNLKLAIAFLFVLSTNMFVLPAYANLSANPIILIFQDGATNRKDITLTNSGTRPQYLEINAYRITKLGAVNEGLKTYPNPKQVGLLVSPRRIILNPNSRKKIRVIRLSTNIKSDEAWRVEITPAKSKVKANSNGVVIQLAYKALVIARPKNAKGILTGRRNGNQLFVRNTGNTNNVLGDGKQCDSRGQNCKKVQGRRLWPNGTWSTKLPYNTKVTFDILGPNDRKQITF